VRIRKHPILEFDKGPLVEFEFDGRRLEGHEGESVAAALHAAGVSVLRHSIRLDRPRGFFCAIGRCSSCLMTIDGVPNVMTCITPLRAGMRIETQKGKGTFPKVAFDHAPEEPDYPRDLGTIPLAIVGGGPAGLSAAIAAARLGVDSVVIDENAVPGGQLIKQTHMFFGSREHHARVRGIDIGEILLDEIAGLPVRVMTDTTVLGLYPGRVLALLRNGRAHRLTAEAVIVATGASENMLAFPGSDLPGVYGAGAVQTLMNVDGVAPGKRVLMIGAGNIGLIVSYQLLQAGVEVAAVVEGLPEIGGYHVHAAKIRRAGVPILTSHTILSATGTDGVDGATIAAVDSSWNPVEGTERELSVDTICLAVGLTPNGELASQLGCEEAFVAELGGRVSVHDGNLETTVPGVYIAGDASGIEEASTAMLEGRLAGLAAASRLRPDADAAEVARLRAEVEEGLRALRAGPFGQHARSGKEKMAEIMRAERGAEAVPGGATGGGGS
jgi:sarcosine oxidase subunit alpha